MVNIEFNKRLFNHILIILDVIAGQVRPVIQEIREVIQPFRGLGLINQCEGKESSNYTFIRLYTLDQNCSLESVQSVGQDQLIACESNGQKTVNTLQILAVSQYPSGGET